MKALASLAINYQCNHSRHAAPARADQRLGWSNPPLVLVVPSTGAASTHSYLKEEDNPHFILGYN